MSIALSQVMMALCLWRFHKSRYTLQVLTILLFPIAELSATLWTFDGSDWALRGL